MYQNYLRYLIKSVNRMSSINKPFYNKQLFAKKIVMLLNLLYENYFIVMKILFVRINVTILFLLMMQFQFDNDYHNATLSVWDLAWQVWKQPAIYYFKDMIKWYCSVLYSFCHIHITHKKTVCATIFLRCRDTFCTKNVKSSFNT